MAKGGLEVRAISSEPAGFADASPIQMKYNQLSGRASLTVVNRDLCAYTTEDRAIAIEDIGAGRKSLKLKTSGELFKKVILDDAGSILVASSKTDLLLWQIPEGTKRWEHRLSEPNSLFCLSPDGKWIAVAGGKRTNVLILDSSSGRIETRIPQEQPRPNNGGEFERPTSAFPFGPTTNIGDLCFSADSRYLFSGRGNEVRIWELTPVIGTQK
jgi:hypothetical protein